MANVSIMVDDLISCQSKEYMVGQEWMLLSTICHHCKKNGEQFLKKAKSLTFYLAIICYITIVGNQVGQSV